MTLDDGILVLCQVVDDARQGGMPQERLAPRKRLWYKERGISYARQYQAAQAGHGIDRLLTTWLYKQAFHGTWYAVAGAEQYRVDAVTRFIGDDGLQYMTMTLAGLEELYDVKEDEDGNAIDKQNPPRLCRKA